MNEYPDEVSLRDLYLILRRGLPLIIILSVLAGAAAFLWFTLTPDRYEGRTAVLVTPTPERSVADGGSSVIARTNVTFQTYESIAFSQAVLRATLQALGDTQTSITTFVNRLELEQLVASAPTTTQTMLEHVAYAPDPAEAARIANAWAEATMASVLSTMLAVLEPIAETNAAELAEHGGNLSLLEGRWRDFERRDETALLQAEVNSYVQRTTQAHERLDSVSRDLAANAARQTVLEEALAELAELEGNEMLTDADTTMLFLQSQELLDPAAAAELAVFLRGQVADVQVLQLLLGLQLQTAVSDAAALEATRETTAQQQAGYAAAAGERRSALSALAQERLELERELRIAEQLYTDSLALSPIIEYVRGVLPGNVRILDPAQPQLEPVSGGRLLPTLIAMVVTGLLATVFVFLRAAVADPGNGRIAADRGRTGTGEAAAG